jgi:hypothetical protein
MRRRVSREQLLDASQSILSPRRKPRWRGGGLVPWGTCQCTSSQTGRKGIRLKFRNLAAEPLALWVASPRRRWPYGCRRPVRRGNATKPGDAGGGPGKSYLFSKSGRGPGNLLEGERVLVTRGTSPTRGGVRVSTVRPLKIRARGTRRCRARSYQYPQQVSEVHSL